MKKRYLSISTPVFYVFFFLLFTNKLPAQMITTVTGGSIGDGQPGASMGIAYLSGMEVDAAGNVYVLDQANARVRKVDATTHIINTIAGNGVSISSGDGGPAINANLGGSPPAMCIDGAVNIYISEGARIRKIDAATGIINTIGGTGASGFSGDGGPAINAQIMRVTAMTVDGTGNIYISDLYRIRRIDVVTGIITTIAGNGTAGYSGDGGPAINAQFAAAGTLTTDTAGNVYFSDANNCVVRRIDVSTGIITTIAGIGVRGSAGDGGPATAATLYAIHDIIFDAAGNLFLTDNNKVRKINTTTGIINTVLGIGVAGYSPDGTNAVSANFNITRFFTIDATGNLYLYEYNNYVIRKIDAVTNTLSTICGNRTTGTAGIGGPASTAQLFQLNSVAADKNGNTYIGDEVNCKIYRIDATTGIITIAAGIGNKGVSNGDGGQATAAAIMTPNGVTVDTSGNFYFVDNYNRVRKVTVATGIITTVAGNGVYAYSGDGGPATAASINRPFALAIDAANNLYIPDRYNNAVRKVSAATGIISTIAGTGTAGHTGDGGPATAAQLNMPWAITVDHAGNVYVSHQNNPVIRRIDAVTGIISTFAGTGVRGFGGDGGPATSALFRILGGLATDLAGNVFVSDESNMRIRKIDIATGIINTIAGTGTVPGGYNGDQIPATTAQFNEPRGICFDPAGNLLIADENNYRLRKVIYDTIPADTTAAFRIALNDQPALNNIAAIYTSKIQPNPAHEQVIISINGPIEGKTTITLTDMWGKVLINQQKTLQQNGSFTTKLPLHQLAKGIYFVTIYANQKKQVHKLIVQ